MSRDKLAKGLFILIAGLAILFTIGGCVKEESRTITAFVGAASKPPMEEAAQAFEAKTGARVYLTFGGSGTILSQMKLSKSGDLYIPGSPDYMAIAEHDGIIDAKSVKILAYLVPVIAVQKGNPKNVQSLADLAKPGIKVGIANPEAVCVGLYAVEVLEYNNLLVEVGKNIVTFAESCEKTATLVALKAVDVVIGWHVFANWQPDAIDVVYLKPELVPRLAYIPAAISTFAKDRAGAQEFLDFLVSPQGQEIFGKWGYIASEGEARKYAPKAKIGGEYNLPESYKRLFGKLSS